MFLGGLGISCGGLFVEMVEVLSDKVLFVIFVGNSFICEIIGLLGCVLSVLIVGVIDREGNIVLFLLWGLLLDGYLVKFDIVL